MAYGSVLTDTVQSSTAATAPVFKDGNGTQIGTLCRAWVNFNGTGTVAIRASFNVSSITDNGAGDYTVNFTTAMPDTNYAVAFSVNTIWGTSLPCPQLNTVISSSTESAPTTTSCRVGNSSLSSGTTGLDPKYCNVSIFR